MESFWSPKKKLSDLFNEHLYINTIFPLLDFDYPKCQKKIRIIPKLYVCDTLRKQIAKM